MTIRKWNNKIYIKKDIKTLVWFQFYFLFFNGVLTDILGLPGFISNILDVLNIAIFIYAAFFRNMWKLQKGQYRTTFIWIFIFFISSIFGLLLTEGSWLLYIWGFRNVFRYYIFFISCILLLDLSDVCKITTILKRIYCINLVICTVELLMGYKGDYLGGIFGTQQGCNGYLNLFLIVVSAIYVTEYLEKKNRIGKTILFLLSAFYIIAIAELKVFVFELLIIILVALFNEKFSMRKFTLIIISIIAMFAGVLMLGYFFSESGVSFFTTNALYDYIGDRGYTNSGDLNRFNAVSQLHKLFLDDSIVKELFGIGLGNASSSGVFSFFNSDFYINNNLLHYQWFTDAYIYIETGAIGLALFEGFFVLIFALTRKTIKKINSVYIDVQNGLKSELKSVVNVTSIVAVLCIVISIYNSSLSMDSAYMVYFLFAVPVIIDMKLNKNIIRSESQKTTK